MNNEQPRILELNTTFGKITFIKDTDNQNTIDSMKKDTETEFDINNLFNKETSPLTEDLTKNYIEIGTRDIVDNKIIIDDIQYELTPMFLFGMDGAKPINYKYFTFEVTNIGNGKFCPFSDDETSEKLLIFDNVKGGEFSIDCDINCNSEIRNITVNCIGYRLKKNGTLKAPYDEEFTLENNYARGKEIVKGYSIPSDDGCYGFYSKMLNEKFPKILSFFELHIQFANCIEVSYEISSTKFESIKAYMKENNLDTLDIPFGYINYIDGELCIVVDKNKIKRE